MAWWSALGYLCEQDMGWTLSWSALSQDWKLWGRHSTGPLPGFCGDVLIDHSKIFALSIGVLFIPSCPGTEALDVSWAMGVVWGGPLEQSCWIPGTPMRSLPPLGHCNWGWWHVGLPR